MILASTVQASGDLGATLEDDPPVRESRVGPVVQAIAYLPVALVFVVCIVLFQVGGGFAPADWYAAALFCLGVALVSALGAPDLSLPGRAAKIAGVSLCAYTCWAFLSILWADVPGDAWQGANLTLLYLLGFLIAAIWRVPIRVSEWMVLGYAAATVAVGMFVLWSASHGSVDPNAGALLGGRLAGPTSYPNATSAGFALALWPALAIALEQSIALRARVVALGVAAALAELSLLCQSRGSMFTLPLVAILFVLLARRRGIALILMSSVALTVAAVAPTLLAVYDADSAAGRQDALSAALVAILVSATALAALGILMPFLDRLPCAEGRVLLSVRIGVAFAATALVIVVLATTSPRAHLSAGWDSFRGGGVPAGSSHFSGLGSNRYDFWRVGLNEFRKHPVQGIGVDNFIVPYLQARQSDEQPLYPHSLIVRVLSQTGVVGAGLLTAFFVAVAFAALGGRAPSERAMVGGLLVGVSAWLLHGFADWLWEMPALGLTAFVLLGLAVGTNREPSSRSHASGHDARLRRVLLMVGSLGVMVAAAASLALPWLSVRYQQRALALWREDAPSALAMLDRSTRLNPLSDRGYVLAGAIASRLGAMADMRDRFSRAVSRNPNNWYAQLELAVAASALGDQSTALRAAREAHRLNPREKTTLTVLRAIERGQPVSPGDVDRAFALQSDAN